MNPFEIEGCARGTLLRFAPADDGKLTMAILRQETSGHDSAIIRPEWLRPLAAWFAGEAERAALGDDLLVPCARRLAVHTDGLAVVYSARTEAWLRCYEPYGPAWVTVMPRRAASGPSVALMPEARQDVATRLRRFDAELRTRHTTAA
jgi:hypothetical protein